MGCGGSSLTCEATLRRKNSWQMRSSSYVLPQGVPVAPDRDTHDLYVRELNIYLSKIERNPETFARLVSQRRCLELDFPLSFQPQQP
mmetsp:Transcript_56531/g.126161  ORF Transcript_56531/g.126161 Transcript_56531/m.126161 type:complete len:87 (-) Transcript_56531:132-392(-)